MFPDQCGRRFRHTQVTRDRLHLQRSRDLPRIRGRRREGGARARHKERGRHRRLYFGKGARRILLGDGRRQHRSKGLHRRFLSTALLRRARARPRHARIRQARDQSLAGDNDAVDPRPQRQFFGDRRALGMGREPARPRRAAAFLGVSSGLEDARRAGNAARDAHSCARNREERRACVTSIPAMFTTRRGRAPIVTPAAHASSAATGTRSPPGRSTTTAVAEAAARNARACSKRDTGSWGARRMPIELGVERAPAPSSAPNP